MGKDQDQAIVTVDGNPGSPADLPGGLWNFLLELVKPQNKAEVILEAADFEDGKIADTQTTRDLGLVNQKKN